MNRPNDNGGNDILADRRVLLDELSVQRVLSDASFEAIFLSEKGVCLVQNRTAETMFGYTDKEAVGRMGIEWIVPEDRDLVMEKMVTGVEAPYLVTALCKDGSTFPCEIRGRMLDFKGKMVRVTALLDITARKEAERALHESERRIRALLAAVPDRIFVLSRDGIFLDYHGPLDERLLARPDYFIGKHISDILRADVATRTMETIERVLRTNEPQPMNYTYEEKGVMRSMESRAAPCGDDCVLFTVRDVTETEQLRTRENRAQRLEAAGRIAGQVAHDFNNLLGPLVGYPELIRKTIAADNPAQEFVDCIEDHARQMAEINQQLLTLGRRGYYSQTVVDLDEIITTAVEAYPPLPERIILETDLAGALPILGGPAQIQRAITNLLHNAVDALDGAGTVVVTTRDIYLDQDRSGFDSIPRGEYVQLTVKDDGCGMDPSCIEQIFEPFYTTKTADRKRGSGLGLSIVKSVVEDHSGFVDVETAPGAGTAVHVLIPITRERRPESTASPEPGRGEAVLVVDDDDLQRRVSVDLLVELGYRATSVPSGEEALAYLVDHPQDLVLLDMIMPGGIDGAETYRRILDINGEQKTIIVSGYAETDRVAEAERLGVMAYVGKPLTLETLGHAVRGGLDSRN